MIRKVNSLGNNITLPSRRNESDCSSCLKSMIGVKERFPHPKKLKSTLQIKINNFDLLQTNKIQHIMRMSDIIKLISNYIFVGCFHQSSHIPWKNNHWGMLGIWRSMTTLTFLNTCRDLNDLLSLCILLEEKPTCLCFSIGSWWMSLYKLLDRWSLKESSLALEVGEHYHY